MKESSSQDFGEKQLSLHQKSVHGLSEFEGNMLCNSFRFLFFYSLCCSLSVNMITTSDFSSKLGGCGNFNFVFLCKTNLTP